MGSDARSGTQLGAYLLADMIGQGGMGVVYRATHVHLRREVALKLLAPDLSAVDDFRDRFLRESRLAASMEHPNIVTVYDAGEIDGALYIAMRFIDGGDLASLIDREGPLGPARTVTMLAQVGGALDAAHGRGLIHRDVKPANVLIDSGRCYLTDFGLTKRAVPDEASAALTRTGQFLGTIDYVAPEQIEGRELDGRADVYALACVLHECLTASRPFPRNSEWAVIGAHLRDPPPRPAELRPELPPAIDEVVARGMAKAPAERYASCSELIAAARQALAVDSDPAGLRKLPATEVGTAAPTKPSARARGQAAAAAAPPAADGATILDGGAPPSDTSRPPGRRRTVLAGAVLLGLGALAAVVVLVAGGSSSHAPARTHGATAGSGRGTAHPPAPSPAQAAHLVGSPFRVGTGPVGIAGNAKVLWVANFNSSTVTRVTLDGRIRTDISVPSGPFGVFNTGARFWVSSALAGIVTPIDVATGLPGKPIPVGRHPEFITGDQNAIYVSNALADSVSVINPRTDTLIGRPIPVGRFPRGLAFSGTAVWVADMNSNDVARIVNAVVVKRIPVGQQPVGVAFGDGSVWVADRGSNSVSRIELLHDKVTTIPVGKAPFGIAFGLGSVWVANSGGGTVTRLSATTGAPIGAPITVGGEPAGIAVIGDSVWVTDRRAGTVARIQP